MAIVRVKLAFKIYIYSARAITQKMKQTAQDDIFLLVQK